MDRSQTPKRLHTALQKLLMQHILTHPILRNRPLLERPLQSLNRFGHVLLLHPEEREQLRVVPRLYHFLYGPLQIFDVGFLIMKILHSLQLLQHRHDLGMREEIVGRSRNRAWRGCYAQCILSRRNR